MFNLRNHPFNSGFLSDPGIPGVRSMGRECLSLSESTFVKLIQVIQVIQAIQGIRVIQVIQVIQV